MTGTTVEVAVGMPQQVDVLDRNLDHYANGRWLPARSGESYIVLEPFTGAPYARVPNCDRADADAAITAAENAFGHWAALAPREKHQLFTRAAEIVQQRRAEIAEVLVRETGCTARFADAQQDVVQAMLHHAAHWVYLPQGQVLATNYSGSQSTAIRRPLGVVASITPWNGGSVLAWRSVLGPLAAGNTVVVKPSEESPVSAGLSVAKVIEEAGFPAGVVNVVTHAPGNAIPIADAFFERDEVRCINFTGSVETGRVLAQRAGQALKRSVMELGGFNPLIILPDVDIDYAARAAAFNGFFHQGQICLNARKVLVAREIYADFLTAFAEQAQSLPYGDPASPETVVGPLINDRAVAAVHDRVVDAVAQGGRIMTGGSFEGRVYQPTILADVPQTAAVQQHETFGPVVTVDPVADGDEAVSIVNRSLYGLTSAILGRDLQAALALGDRLKSGAVHINSGTVNDELQAPVGGVRNSGWGRSGPESIADFTDLVWVTIQRGERVSW